MAELHKKTETINGDAFISACYIAYMGAFPKKYREEKFLPDIKTILLEENIFLDEEFSLAKVLCNQLTIGTWCNE